jgi:hypothetical protein
VYFYELHEGDADLLSDVLLVHDEEFDEEEFLELVLEARSAVLRSFGEDTLVEAVANELERRHGFTFIHDARLRVAVLVSGEEGDTAVVGLDEGDAGDEEDEDEDEDGARTGFRSLVVDMDRTPDLN